MNGESLKIAYCTTHSPADEIIFSGSSFHMGKALETVSSITYTGPLTKPVSFYNRVRSKLHREFSGARYSLDWDGSHLKDLAQQTESILSHQPEVDMLLSPGCFAPPITFIKTKKPRVYWTDSTFAGLLQLYTWYDNVCPAGIKEAHRTQKEMLERFDLTVFSSQWALETAVEHYGASRDKLRVVPFGANIKGMPDDVSVEELCQLRGTDVCKLLFMTVDWQRKGGAIAVKIAESLNAAGLKTELTIIGIRNQNPVPESKCVKNLGYVSKATPSGLETIQRALMESHFLVLPTRGDCTPIVVYEACAFALPCVVTNIGGTSSQVTNGVNGQLFSPEADIDEYCKYIIDMMANQTRYVSLMHSTLNEYRSRLNWQSSALSVRSICNDYFGLM